MIRARASLAVRRSVAPYAVPTFWNAIPPLVVFEILTKLTLSVDLATLAHSVLHGSIRDS